jgi:hypothetical protein
MSSYLFCASLQGLRPCSFDKHRRCNFSFSLGQRPRISKIQKWVALKARFMPPPDSTRAFSAISHLSKNPGALPQATNDTAPSALNKCVRAEANVCR